MGFLCVGFNAGAACLDQRVQLLGALAEDLHRQSVPLRAGLHHSEAVDDFEEDFVRCLQLAVGVVEVDAQLLHGVGGFAALGHLAHAPGQLGHGAGDGREVGVCQTRHVLELLEAVRAHAELRRQRQDVVRITGRLNGGVLQVARQLFGGFAGFVEAFLRQIREDGVGHAPAFVRSLRGFGGFVRCLGHVASRTRCVVSLALVVGQALLRGDDLTVESIHLGRVHILRKGALQRLEPALRGLDRLVEELLLLLQQFGVLRV